MLINARLKPLYEDLEQIESVVVKCAIKRTEVFGTHVSSLTICQAGGGLRKRQVAEIFPLYDALPNHALKYA